MGMEPFLYPSQGSLTKGEGTVDLLVPTSLDLLLLIMKLHFSFLQNNLSYSAGQLQLRVPWKVPFKIYPPVV